MGCSIFLCRILFFVLTYPPHYCLLAHFAQENVLKVFGSSIC
nr:MAG TPA: hypothetical protein [Caudoviricetes sp.]